MTFEEIFKQVSRISGYGELTFSGTTERHNIIKELINNYDKRIAVQTKAQRQKGVSNFYTQIGTIEYDLPSGTDQINDMYILSDNIRNYLQEIGDSTWNMLKEYEEDFDEGVSIDATGAVSYFGATGATKVAQSFIPTGPNIKGVSIKVGYVADFTGTVTIALQKDSSGDPSGTNLVSYTITNNDIKQDPDGDNYRFVPLEYTVGDKSNVSFWIVYTASTTHATNKPFAVYNSGASVYADGQGKAYDGAAWAALGAGLDISLKVHFGNGESNVPVYYNISGNKIRLYPTPDTVDLVVMDRFVNAGSMTTTSDIPTIKAGFEELLEFGPASDILLRRGDRGLSREYKDKYDELLIQYKDDVLFPTNNRVVKYAGYAGVSNPNLNPTITAI